MSDGHCTEVARCVCGGDLSSVRAGCHYWRASAPQQAQDIAEASGGAEGGPEEDRIEAAFWNFDARHKGYGQWRQAPMSERDAFKAEMRNALHAEAVRAEMRMVAKGWRKQGPQQAQETSLPPQGAASPDPQLLTLAQRALAASPAPAPQEPLQVFSKGPWLFEETGQRFTGKELDEAAFEKYRTLYASPAPGALGAVDASAPASLRGLDTPTRVRFYEHDFYVLSNFSAFTVTWDGKRHQTSEHLYHYLKFNTVIPAIADRIFDAPSAHEAFKLAERNKGLRRKDWDAVKVELMRDILRLKVEQHEYVRRKLLATGDRELVEDSWRDDFWGWGPNRDGKNMLGRLWMQVRSELMAAPESPLTQQAPSESSAQGSGGEKA